MLLIRFEANLLYLTFTTVLFFFAFFFYSIAIVLISIISTLYNVSVGTILTTTIQINTDVREDIARHGEQIQ